MDTDINKREKLSPMSRFKRAGWALLCMLAAVVLLLYGVSLTTNLLTQLNPLNTLVYISVAVFCYAVIAACFYGLWQTFSRLLTQVISGFKA